MNPRAIAAKILAHVISDGQSLTQALNQSQVQAAGIQSADSDQNQALVQEMCYGVMRWQFTLQFWLSGLLQKPIKAKDVHVEMLLLVGLYQLEFMRTPNHAAVAETVKAVGNINKPWARGLVNAVLRSFLRKRDDLKQQAENSQVAKFSHPQWLINAVKQAWPQKWQSILIANNERPPMSLRVNSKRYSRDDYLNILSGENISAQPLQHSTVGIVLDSPAAVTALPEFEQGAVSVQDEAAQLAAPLLDLQTGQRVLDVCAAPGGKTMHILESEPGIAKLVAVDIEASRALRIQNSLKRLQLSAEVIVGDATKPDSWWQGEKFDRILLDAPCSALGVIRRHPDIKHLRRASDIESLVHLQGQILEAIWPLLKLGGMMLYATCSILPQENSQQISRFLSRHADAECAPLDKKWGLDVKPGRQILSGDDSMDGFYYARLRKI